MLLILHGTADRVTKFAGSQLFYERAGSPDKTIKLYEGHFHDLLNDIDKEAVIADMKSWIDARLPAIRSVAQVPGRSRRAIWGDRKGVIRARGAGPRQVASPTLPRITNAIASAREAVLREQMGSVRAIFDHNSG